MRRLCVLFLVLAACPRAVPFGPQSAPSGSVPHVGARAPAGTAARGSVPLAVTIDDLPFVGPTVGREAPARAVARIVNALAATEVPAAGFVVCARAEADPAALDVWRASGLVLGNHSDRHPSLDEVGATAWLADVARCQRQLTDWLGTAPRWFRYPYLQTGAHVDARDHARDGVAALALTRAPVTVDTSDWLLARAYVSAYGTPRAVAVADAYVEHVRRAWRHYRAVARARTNAEVPQVLLLHANALVADHLPRLLAALRVDGARFVPLAEALSHPVYAPERDDWIDPVGASWLYRLAPADKPAWAWDQGQQRALAARFFDRDETRPYRVGPATRVRRLSGTRAWVVRHDQPVAANALVYETEDGTPVLVDTPWTSTATLQVLDWAAARFGRPVALAIVGHYHADSAGGVSALRAAGVPTIGSAHTARLIVERGAALQRALIERYGSAFAGSAPVPPARTFEGHVELTVGGSRIEVFHPGPAHSPDNVVTYFPESGVLFGGCMVKGGPSLGYLGDADLAAWPAAIERLVARAPKVVVPGHGDRTDPELLAHTLDLLRAHAADGREAATGRRGRR